MSSSETSSFILKFPCCVFHKNKKTLRGFNQCGNILAVNKFQETGRTWLHSAVAMVTSAALFEQCCTEKTSCCWDFNQRKTNINNTCSLLSYEWRESLLAARLIYTMWNTTDCDFVYECWVTDQFSTFCVSGVTLLQLNSFTGIYLLLWQLLL